VDVWEVVVQKHPVDKFEQSVPNMAADASKISVVVAAGKVVAFDDRY
jgi:hypothetical protein